MRARTVKSRLNNRQKIVVILMDLFLLIELTWCMYQGSLNREQMAADFLRLYIPMLLVTVITARIMIKRFRDPEPATTSDPAPADA